MILLNSMKLILSMNLTKAAGKGKQGTWAVSSTIFKERWLALLVGFFYHSNQGRKFFRMRETDSEITCTIADRAGITPLPNRLKDKNLSVLPTFLFLVFRFRYSLLY